jgi:hypothetical protein
MKIALILVAVVVALIAMVGVIGALLPQHHVATRAARFKASPERLFALIAGNQSWRPDLKVCELVTGADGTQLQRETSLRGETIAYALEDAMPPHTIRRRIATQNLPYGGSWRFVLEPVAGGTRVQITEDGDVYNPVFRFVSKLVVGHTATLDAYLRALGKATGEEIQPGN